MSFRLGNVFSKSTPNLCRFRYVLIIYLIRYELGIPQTTDDWESARSPLNLLHFPPTAVKEEHATFRVLLPELLVCPAMVLSNLTPGAGAAGNNGSGCRCADWPGGGVAAGPPTPPDALTITAPPPPSPLPAPADASAPPIPGGGANNNGSRCRYGDRPRAGAANNWSRRWPHLGAGK
jgi:hypothetical protein